jgi:uncharacterized protein YuzE
MQLKYDPEADAIYVRLTDRPYSFGEDLDHDRRIDYDQDKAPMGIELLNVSDGVNLDNLPDSDAIAALLVQHHIPVYA